MSYLSDFPITSPFGARAGGFHNGVDFGTPTGTPVPAIEGGTVVLAQPIAPAGPSTDWDKAIVIQHAGGYISYHHLDQIRVSKGQKVSKGQIIALSGNTGYSFGPHLHVEEHSGTFRQFLSDGPVVDITPRLKNYSIGGHEVTREQDFANCFITVAQRWPTQKEVDAWKASGLEPYTWVQRHAPNNLFNHHEALRLYQLAREKAGAKYPGGAEKFATDRILGGDTFPKIMDRDMKHYVSQEQLLHQILAKDTPAPLSEQDKKDLELGRKYRALSKEANA